MKYYRAVMMHVNQLKFKSGVWSSLMRDLARRGRGERESGAFLLVDKSSSSKCIDTWIAYDDLSSSALSSDYVRLDQDAFSALWSYCDNNRLEIIADVHTHMTYPMQSVSDRAYPMIAIPGHVALIVPFYARNDPQPKDVSFNVYLGAGKWISYYREEADDLINIQ